MANSKGASKTARTTLRTRTEVKLKEVVGKAEAAAERKLQALGRARLHRVEEEAQKLSHRREELAAKLTHAARAGRTKVKHRATEVRTTLEHRLQELSDKLKVD